MNFCCGFLLRVKAGDLAPEFTLKSQNGEPVTLSQYREQKNVVLYFCPKDETSGRNREASAFRDSYALFSDLGAEVIGVNADTVESHNFAEHHNLPFTLLGDIENMVRKISIAESTLEFVPGRVTFVIDKHGIVRGIFIATSTRKTH